MNTRPASSRNRFPAWLRAGFTLVELMVAMFILILLTGGMVAMLRGAMDTWRLGERHREVYDSGQFIMNTVIRDLKSFSYDANYYWQQYREPNWQSWFLAEYDENNRKRMRFLGVERGGSIGDTMSSTVNALDPPPDRDFYPGYDFNRYGLSGLSNYHDSGVKPACANALTEYFYMMGEDPASRVLYRGELPAQWSPRTVRNSRDPRLNQGIPAIWTYFAYRFEDVETQVQIDRVARPIARDILFFDVEFWGQNTIRWEDDKGFPEPAVKGGPEVMWDSTRALYAPISQTNPLNYKDRNPNNTFSLTLIGTNSFYPDGSVYRGTEPAYLTIADDVFPLKARITLVIDSNNQFSPRAKLVEDQGSTLLLSSTRYFPTTGYIRIQNEWIYYENIDGNKLTGCLRGQRNTVAASYSAGTDILLGVTFREVVEIPAGRNSAPK